MELNKKGSKFAQPEPKWQPEAISAKTMFAGLSILAAACFSAVYVQRGIDGSSTPSLMGFVTMIMVGGSVAYCLEKIITKVFFHKNKVQPLATEYDELDQYLKRPSLELQKEIEASLVNEPEALTNEDAGAIEVSTWPKTGSVKELRERLKEPRSKADFYVRLIRHLVMVGQIEDPKMTDEELTAYYFKNDQLQ